MCVKLFVCFHEDRAHVMFYCLVIGDLFMYHIGIKLYSILKMFLSQANFPTLTQIISKTVCHIRLQMPFFVLFHRLWQPSVIC